MLEIELRDLKDLEDKIQKVSSIPFGIETIEELMKEDLLLEQLQNGNFFAAMQGLIGFIKDNPDVSLYHDDYLYGSRK